MRLKFRVRYLNALEEYIIKTKVHLSALATLDIYNQPAPVFIKPEFGVYSKTTNSILEPLIMKSFDYMNLKENELGKIDLKFNNVDELRKEYDDVCARRRKYIQNETNERRRKNLSFLIGLMK